MVNANRRKSYWVAPLLLVAGNLAGYLIYKRFISKKAVNGPDSPERTNDKPFKSLERHIDENKKVAIVVSSSLLQSGIPLMLLLSRYPNLVVVLAKDVSTDDSQLISQIPISMEHKVIPCETEIGVVHILKHLKPQYAVLAADVAGSIEGDIKRYVGQITSLTGDMEADNNTLGELFF